MRPDHEDRDPGSVLASVGSSGVVPLVSSSDADVLWYAAEAVVESGLNVLEVVFRTPGAAGALAVLVDRVRSAGLPIVVGAGTVLDAGAADAAVEAGARFVFSPALSAEVGRRCRSAGIAWFPGCATPTEVQTALDLGCDAVKVFPADALGGPGFLRSLRSVFPGVAAIPSGGVVPTSPELSAWFDAGAHAVGVGSWLFPRESIAAGDWEEVRRRLASAATAVETARGGER